MERLIAYRTVRQFTVAAGDWVAVTVRADVKEAILSFIASHELRWTQGDVVREAIGLLEQSYVDKDTKRAIELGTDVLYAFLTEVFPDLEKELAERAGGIAALVEEPTVTDKLRRLLSEALRDAYRRRRENE